MHPEDNYQNQRGLAQCGMIMSVFQTPDGTAYWIQTHGTRSHTLILLPGELSSLRRILLRTVPLIRLQRIALNPARVAGFLSSPCMVRFPQAALVAKLAERH